MNSNTTCRPHFHHSLQALVCLAALATPAFADVLVVDGTGAGEFTDLTQAVAASASGDVILVRPGTYLGDVDLQGRGLTVVADAPGTVVVDGMVRVAGLSAGRFVVLSGLELRSGFTFEDCDGQIQVRDCVGPRHTAGVNHPGNLGFPQMGECGIGVSSHTARNCARVVLTDCTLTGEDGLDGFDGEPGEHGLLVADSRVLLFDCTLMGGHGGEANWGFGHGAVIGGAGGDGLRLLGADAEVTYEGLVTVGGMGAQAPTQFDISGCNGVDVRGLGGAALTRPPVSFDVPPILRGQAPATFLVEGPVGSTVIFASAQNPGWRPLGLVSGNLTVGNPLRISVHGPIPAGAPLAVQIDMFDPPTQDDFVHFFFQAVVLTGNGRLVTEPQHTVVLHPSL